MNFTNGVVVYIIYDTSDVLDQAKDFYIVILTLQSRESKKQQEKNHKFSANLQKFSKYGGEMEKKKRRSIWNFITQKQNQFQPSNQSFVEA